MNSILVAIKLIIVAVNFIGVASNPILISIDCIISSMYFIIKAVVDNFFGTVEKVGIDYLWWGKYESHYGK